MSVLDPLLEAARARARHDARITPIGELRRQVAAMPPATRFEAALRYADRLAIVAEVKRRSPSAGEFASVAAGPAAVAALARSYADAGAAALSILTEPTRFGGSDDDLSAAARLGPPVLRKDFTVDPVQVWQARALGAGAVLLIVRALSDEELRGAASRPRPRRGSTRSSRFTTSAELERALAADATLIGVNARDLDSLEVSRDRVLDLLKAAQRTRRDARRRERHHRRLPPVRRRRRRRARRARRHGAARGAGPGPAPARVRIRCPATHPARRASASEPRRA